MRFWEDINFWLGAIGIAVSGLGAWISWHAFQEAKKAKGEAGQAKNAANRAGRLVKSLTVANELNEVQHQIQSLKRGIPFDEARELLNGITQRILRNTAFVQNDAELKIKFDSLKASLDSAEGALSDVKPNSAAEEELAHDAIYNAIEGPFTAIGKALADFLGHLENKTMTFKDDHDNG